MSGSWFKGVGVLLVAGAVITGWAATHHVVQTSRGTVIVAKRYVTLDASWVDARSWKSADYEAHGVVREALVAGGYGGMLFELRREELAQEAEQMRREMVLWFETLRRDVLQKARDWLAELGLSLETEGGSGIDA